MKKEESKEEESEDSELEEEIEDEEEEIEDDKFQRFFEHSIEMPDVEDGSPSLERINIAPETPIRLERGLAGSRVSKQEDEEIKYGAGLYKKEEEPKYKSEGMQTLEAKGTDIENLGRGEFTQMQNVGLIQSNEIPKTQEEYMNPESQRIEDLGKNENPFSPKEIKYKPVA